MVMVNPPAKGFAKALVFVAAALPNVVATAASANLDGGWNRALPDATLQQRAGDLAIPPIAQAANKKPAHSRGDFYIDIQLSKEKVYVQQEIRATVKVFMRHAVRGSLTPLEVKKGRAIIRSLGQGKNYRSNIGGKSFQVHEVNYLIYPQVSGALEMKKVKLNGRYTLGGRRRSVSRDSDSLRIQVSSAPSSYKGDKWLPAEWLKLQETLADNPDELQVGKPFTRKMVLSARGVIEGQLPTLALEIEGFKTYENAPRRESRIENGGLTSFSRQDMVMIPTEAGKVVLPEIRVPWWNVQKNKTEWAKAPAKTVTVADAPVDAFLTLETPVSFSNDGDATQAESFWIWTSAALGALWLLTGMAWAWQGFAAEHARKLAARREQKRAAESVRALRRRLRGACENNDAPATREALMAWARTLGAPTDNLSAVGAHFGGEAARQIEVLNRSLYAPDAEAAQWDGAALWSACAELKKTQEEKKPTAPSALKPLHPAYTPRSRA